MFKPLKPVGERRGGTKRPQPRGAEMWILLGRLKVNSRNPEPPGVQLHRFQGLIESS